MPSSWQLRGESAHITLDNPRWPPCWLIGGINQPPANRPPDDLADGLVVDAVGLGERPQPLPSGVPCLYRGSGRLGQASARPSVAAGPPLGQHGRQRQEEWDRVVCGKVGRRSRMAQRTTLTAGFVELSSAA